MSVIKITKDNFEEAVLESENPVLLDFWAEWCGPCQMVAPVLEEIAQEKPEITIGKVNVDEQPELTESFNVTNIPLLVLMKDGQIVKQSVGYKTKEELIELFEL
ncbi:MAG: thioredoxin [Acutalibacteraceae bacterium]|jgi:thioredoxin 1